MRTNRASEQPVADTELVPRNKGNHSKIYAEISGAKTAIHSITTGLIFASPSQSQATK